MQITSESIKKKKNSIRAPTVPSSAQMCYNSRK